VVRTLDNVALELPLAGVASRGLAFAVDSLLLLVLQAFLLVVLLGGATLAGAAPGWALAAAVGLSFLSQWWYFALAEIALRGATPGKAVLGLRTVAADGGRPSAGALILRNLVRGIPDLFVGVFLMAADPLARRVGDRLAGTVVIREGRPRPRPTLTRVPPGWGAAEIAAVETYLERLPDLEPDVARRLGERIVRWLERDAPELLDGVEVEGREPAEVVREALGVERL